MIKYKKGSLQKIIGMAPVKQQEKLGVATSDGSNYQPMSNGRALINNKAVAKRGVQEDSPELDIAPARRLGMAKTKGMQPRAGFGAEDYPMNGVQDGTNGDDTYSQYKTQGPRGRTQQLTANGQGLQGGINEYGRQSKKLRLRK